MTEHESGLIERAVEVLRESMQAGGEEQQQTRAVRLALWALRRHCPSDWLKQFWNAAGGKDAIGRSQSLGAAYNGIVRQLRAGGRINW